MKNKKIIALLILLSVIQLVFPLYFMANEKITMNAVIEKGTAYTLDFTAFNYFSAEQISLNTDSIYTVGFAHDGYVWSSHKNEDESYINSDPVSVFREIGIHKDEKGDIGFFDLENCDKSLLKNDNWFDTLYAFQIDLNDYEFASDKLDLKGLFELSVKLGDYYNEIDFGTFTQKHDGYYDGIFDIPLEGKITLRVYNGHAKITELYIGNELILRLK